MALRSANILFKDESAGTLVETANGGTRFAYHSDWNKGNIACGFPSTQREHEWKVGLHPFFQHLGPEGWLREQQARSAHVVEEDVVVVHRMHGCQVRPGHLALQAMADRLGCQRLDMARHRIVGLVAMHVDG